MPWLVYALAAPAVYATVNFIDKYLLSKKIKDYLALPIYTAIVGGIAGLIFWIITGFPILPFSAAVIILFTGILTGWSLLAYFKALDTTETSKIIILFQMFPVITLILAAVFLREVISIKQFVGFILIITAAIFISLKKENKQNKLSSAFFYILIYDILWASSGVLMKFTLISNSFSKVLCYESWGIALGGLMIFILVPKVRNAFNKSIKKIKICTLIILFLNEAVFVLAKSLSFFAFSLGPASLVSVLENTQIFYGIIFGSILTLLFPQVFKEDIRAKNLTRKIFLTIVLFIGILLVV